MPDENVFATAVEAALEQETVSDEPVRSSIVNHRPSTKKFPCTEPGCDREFDDNRGLGTHRRTKHGILGMSSAAVTARQKRKEAEAVAKAAAKRPSGRPVGSTINNGAKPPVKPTVNKSHHALVPRRVEEAVFPLALVGYSMAKLEDLGQKIGRENGLEEKPFVREVVARLNDLLARMD